MKGLSIAPNPLNILVRPRRFERLTHSLEVISDKYFSSLMYVNKCLQFIYL